MREIVGMGEVIGEITIQIPFTDLGIIIDVDFAVMKTKCPSQLSNRDIMLNSELYISLQGSYIHI